MHHHASVAPSSTRPVLLRGIFVVSILTVLVFAVAPLSAAEPTARLGAVSGIVAVTYANGSAIQPAGPGTNLGAGSRVSTVGTASAIVELPGIGQVELGADTTIVIHELRAEGGTAAIEIEIVQGTIVNRLAPTADTRLDYRVVEPSGQAVARTVGSGTFGVGRDENGNVTVACQSCPNGVLTFPGDRLGLSSGQARTATARGEVVDRALGGSIYDALAEGASDDDGGITPSGNRLPPGQRTGSRDERRAADQQDDDKPTSDATPTPTPLPTLLPTPTPTRGTVIDQEATIANFVYLPDPVQIRVGQTVRWTNLDDVPDDHTVTAVDLSWTSPVLEQGDTFVRTFTEAGTFTYFCEPHPAMRADIEVSP